jgi:hypothetical protein
MPDGHPKPTVEYPMSCGHQECRCPAAPHSSYCGEECESAAKLGGTKPCPCSHAECLGY